MNAHDTVMAGLLAVLRQAPAVTTGLIDEDVDETTVPEGVNECVSVELVDSNPDNPAIRGNPVYWRSQFVLSCFARADGRTPRGRASRELHARVYARLKADPSLGGVALDVLEPQLRMDHDQQDNRLGCVIAAYVVVHRTSGRILE